LLTVAIDSVTRPIHARRTRSPRTSALLYLAGLPSHAAPRRSASAATPRAATTVAAHTKGTCANAANLREDTLRAVVLDAIGEQIQTPARLAEVRKILAERLHDYSKGLDAGVRRNDPPRPGDAGEGYPLHEQRLA